MDVPNRLHIGPSLIDARMNPEFGIRSSIAGQLVAFDVEYEQIIFTHQRRTHPRRKNERIGSGDARAHVAESSGDALLVQNVACSYDVLLELIDVHSVFPCASAVSTPIRHAKQNVHPN